MVGHLTQEEIKELLANNILGHIGCTDGNCVYIVPINYLYDGTDIICHSRVGKKTRMMQANPNVCFEVDEIKDYNNWRSVVINGLYKEVTEEDEKWNVMQRFVDSTMRLKISETAHLPEISAERNHPRADPIKTVVYKIVIQQMSGRFESLQS